MATVLRGLFDRLRSDPVRKDALPFSGDIATVHEVIFHPYATRSDQKSAFSKWFQRNQPCLFGRIAAAANWLHYCIISEADIQRLSDEEIAGKIQAAWLDWQRRSLRPDLSEPAHGFLVLVVSPRVAFAEPNNDLKLFSEKVRKLWGCKETAEPQGTLHWETLCLRNPTDRTYVKFTFGVDYFASAGDGRWWHDHRIPGGLGFTANSVGHMRRAREWYQNLTGQDQWVLKTAMETIASAAKTPYGPATWLKELGQNGEPLAKELKCPFTNPDRLSAQLKGKDWTRYGGFLHTDHSIRDEFFHLQAEQVGDIVERAYIQDFSYLYDPKAVDHILFVTGQPVAEAEVFAVMGSPESWNKVEPLKTKPSKKPEGTQSFPMDEGEKVISSGTPAADAGRHEVQMLLRKCSEWELSQEERSEILAIL